MLGSLRWMLEGPWSESEMSSGMIFTRSAVFAATLPFLLVYGCAKAPTLEMDAADQAITNAVGAGAEEYAPESLGRARDLRAELETELTLQQEKMYLTRSYDHALDLANQIKAAGDRATSDAVAGKESARQETSALLAEVKVALADVQAMLAKAPTGKGTAADLAALQEDIDSAVAILGESEAAFAEGRYLEAKSKVMAVKSGTESVKAAIDAAIQARTGRRGPTS